VRLWESIQGWLAFFRGLTLAAGSALSCGVSAAGLALLLFLALTLTFAPANDTFSRRLELDYVGGDLVGEAAFLPEAATADGLPRADVNRDARCCEGFAWMPWTALLLAKLCSCCVPGCLWPGADAISLPSPATSPVQVLGCGAGGGCVG
jgi:hypothetical protein